MSISVLILTLDEEQNLPRCLDAVKWCDDVVVFDSFSSDRTVEIARAAGARVVQRKFDNERDHRRASLQVGFKHKWVFNPDADEIATPELREEMQAAVHDATRPEVAYRCRFKTMFMGRWIRYSSLYPTWVMRLFQPDRIRFERTINLEYVADGAEGKLQNHFLHSTFNKGMSAWFDKHNRYSSFEAGECLRSLEHGDFRAVHLLSNNPSLRRKALKQLSFRIPCRPVFRFLYMYLVRLGFMDGWAGFTYCRLLSIYEYMIVLKMKEIQRRERNLAI